MSSVKLVCVLLCLGLLTGCSVLPGGKLLTPERFGLTEVAPNLYVEADADEPMRTTLRDAVARAEAAIRRAYGDVRSHPRINACISEACYDAFGGERGSIAKIYGHRMLLSPRGLNWHFIAHEWSHDEIRTRLNLRAWWRLPQWFDEGVAVAISEAPEHSETHWQMLVASNIPRPTTEELHGLVSLRQWFEALRRYSGGGGDDRKTGPKTEYRPVYSAAGHELRGWLANVGTAGLLAFIERMNEGEDFECAYRSGNVAFEKFVP